MVADWMSDDLLARTASSDKHIHLLEGANQATLCRRSRIGAGRDQRCCQLSSGM